MKKRIFFVICVMVLLGAVFTGCGKEQSEDADYYIYYLNKNQTKLAPMPYEPETTESEALLGDMILKLGQNPDSVDYNRPLTGHAEIVSWSLENGQLQLNFSLEYSQMDKVAEVLCRAAVVRTLTQVKAVDFVVFYVGDAPLTDQNGTPIGLMTAESFIENPGEQINAIQTATITLYFANQQGNGLVQEIQERHYNSNISLEKLVMEQLLKGPTNPEYRATIPEGTSLVSVSVLDGICFVNLDADFLNQNYEIEEGVVIYSIVNSLAELPSVNRVQISVNGDTSITYREQFSLGTQYERNLDYLVTAGGEELTEETEEGQEGGNFE